MFELPDFEERARALVNAGALAISKSRELQAELLELCNSINRPLNGQFKNGCRNCINDGILFLQIALKKQNTMKKNTTDKYIKPAGKVYIGGNRFDFNKLDDASIEQYLKRFPQLSKVVKLNPDFGKKVEKITEVEAPKVEEKTSKK